MWKPNNKQNIIFINAAIFDSKGKFVIQTD